MKVILYFLFAVVIVFGALIVDFPTMLILLTAYLVGILITRSLNTSQNKTISVYSILFLTGATYMIACYLFMTDKGFDYLFAPDIYGSFFPMNEYYLSQGNYLQIVAHIWDEYQFFDRKFVGYYTYSALWGVIARVLDANLFVTLQISVLFLYSFIGVVIFKLLLKCNFKTNAAFKYTLIISLCSILFFYSSIFLRDIHVALLYLSAIYLTFNTKFSLITLLKIVVLIFLTCVFRIESGLFLIVTIPVYLLLSLQNSKYKIVVISISIVVYAIIGLYILNNRNTIEVIVTNNREAYIESEKGTGIIGTLQSIPIFGDFASIVYNALQPIPFWSRLAAAPNSKYGEPVDNIMNFPLSLSSLFHWFVIFYIFFWLINKDIRIRTIGYITKPLQFHLWVGLVFLLLQSSVVSQRRLMAYYVIYYIFFLIIYNRVDKVNRRYLNAVAIYSFGLLQLVGLIYKILNS